MDPSLRQFIQIHELSTGRRIVSIRKALTVARALGNTDIIAQAERALAHDRETRKLDLAWLGYRNGYRRGSSNLSRIDNQLNHALGGVRDGAQSLAKGAPDGDELAAKVEEFITAILPGGLYAVTSLPFVDKLAAVETIAEKLRGTLAPRVAELHLTLQVQRFLELVNEYRLAHQSDSPDDIQFSQVEQARKQGQMHLLELIALILGTYYKGDDPEHIANRTALLAPIAEQSEAVRKYVRSRRSVRDIDPDTGELDAEPADEAAAAALADGAPAPQAETPASA